MRNEKTIWVRSADGTDIGRLPMSQLLNVVERLGADYSIGAFDYDIDVEVATVYCDADLLEEVLSEQD